MITKHFEHNFFPTFESKKLDDYILYEDYVKMNADTNRISENYSIFSFEALLIFLNSFQIKLINLKFNFNFSSLQMQQKQQRQNKQNFEKFLNVENFIGKFFTNKKNDVLLNLINQHMKNMIDDVMQMSVINPEAELNICQSLFFLKMIVKENPFYFTRKELENLFNKIKGLKE